MADLHERLDRRAQRLQLAPDAWERLHRRAHRRQRNRRLGAGLVAVIVFTGAGAGLWAAFRPADIPPPVTAATRPEVTATIPIDDGVTDVAVGFGSVWVAGPHHVTRLDPSTGDVVQVIEAPGGGDSRKLSVGPDALWMTDPEFGSRPGLELGARSISRVDPATGRVAATLPIDGVIFDIAADDGSVWVAHERGSICEVIEVDPGSNRVTGRAVGVAPFPLGVIAGEGSLWVASPEAEVVQEVDVEAGVVVGELGATSRSMVVADRTLWAIDGDFVVAYDLDSFDRLARIPVERAVGLALGGETLWVLSQAGSVDPVIFLPDPAQPATVSRIDTRTLDPVGGPLRVSESADSVAAGTEGVWVGSSRDRVVVKVELVECEPRACEATPSPTPALSATPGEETPCAGCPIAPVVFALWPDPAASGSWRTDWVETSIRFARDVLAWPDAASLGGEPAHGSATTALAVEREPGGPRIHVLLQVPHEGGDWSVVGVSPDPPADQGPFSVDVSGSRADLGGLDRYPGVAFAVIRFVYEGRPMVEVSTDRPLEGVSVDLGFEPDTPGYALVLLYDDESLCFGAVSASLPAGEFAAG